MNRSDEQTLREMRYFTRELVKYADVLPAGLAVMLRDYEPQLYRSLPGRWDGIGDAGQSEPLAARIGRRLTDGQWPEGARLDACSDEWHAWGASQGTAGRALRLLAARGELALRDGTYCTRPRDEGP